MPAVPAQSKNLLQKIYYDPSHPAGFAGAAALARAARLPLFQVREWLRGQPTYTLHKPARRRFPTRPYRVGTVDQQWQADLVEMQPYAKANAGNRYLLTIIDLFSRYGWAEPLHNKTAKEVAKALETVMTRSGRHPILLQTDQGKEFENAPVRQLLTRHGGRQFSVKSPFKAAVVERFNRTLKTKMWRAFTHQNTYRYLEVLPQLLSAYNQTAHRGLAGKSPNEVVGNPEEQAQLWDEQNSAGGQVASTARFQAGDTVRLAREKGPFAKGYVPNWTEEVFRVRDVRTTTKPVTYTVEDEQGELLEGAFYAEELQRVDKPKLYRIERIVRWWTGKDGSRMAFVKWVGFPKSKNSWIHEADIQQL